MRNPQLQSPDRPAPFCELFPIRDFLDNVMVKTDGSYVAGYRIRGAMTYFASENDRNEVKGRLDAIVRTCPEESMRIQFRYEVTDRVDHTIEQYEEGRRTDNAAAISLDQERIEIWRNRAAAGEYLNRDATVWLIWDPQAYRRVMSAAGTPWTGAATRQSLSPSRRQCISVSARQHEGTLAQFNTILRGIESSMHAGDLRPERLTHEEIFLEIQKALAPFSAHRAQVRHYPLSERYRSAREQLVNEHLYGQKEDYARIGGALWTVVTLKEPPDRTWPGIMRELQTLGFPMTISTSVDIPNQTKVRELYRNRQKKMLAVQTDGRGHRRVDVAAEVSAAELGEIQARILSSSTKACHAAVSVAIRTSTAIRSEADLEAAERELAVRREQVIHVISRMEGATALPEAKAQLRILIRTLPGLADKILREQDLLSAHAADLLPVEMPWDGTPRSPLMLFPTPYRQLIPFSPFDSTLENANALITATSGSGKTMLAQKLMLTAARENTMVSILERGDSYLHTVRYMGGEMLTMSLDSPYRINPFDLGPGETEPSNDQRSFLVNLIRHMVGDSTASDPEILNIVLEESVRNVYLRAMGRDEKIPTLSDVYDELEHYIDRNKQEVVEREAKVAAIKLRTWVNNGMYANLFDRPTNVNMRMPWLYFNIEQLKDDPRLETAMSLLIAYATSKRAEGQTGARSITALDECWALLQSPSLGPQVEQLFRTARKRNACVWGISQAVEDFTGTPDKPNRIGGAILTTTALRFIGRQKGNLDVLREFLHLSSASIERIKDLGMTEKGRQSEFLICIGERSATTHSFYVQPTPTEYWLATTYPRDRQYRSWWLRTCQDLEYAEAIRELARKFPHGMAAMPEQPEERSGEVTRGITQATELTRQASSKPDGNSRNGHGHGRRGAQAGAAPALLPGLEPTIPEVRP